MTEQISTPDHARQWIYAASRLRSPTHTHFSKKTLTEGNPIFRRPYILNFPLDIDVSYRLLKLEYIFLAGPRVSSLTDKASKSEAKSFLKYIITNN